MRDFLWLLKALSILVLLGLGLGCAAPLGIVLESPKTHGDAFKDEHVKVSFEGNSDRLRINLLNVGRKRLVVHWDRSRLVNAKDEPFEMRAFTDKHPPKDLLNEEQQALVLEPAESWSGFVHRRDRLTRGSGNRLVVRSLLGKDDGKVGETVVVRLGIDLGSKPEVYTFSLLLKAPGK